MDAFPEYEHKPLQTESVIAVLNVDPAAAQLIRKAASGMGHRLLEADDVHHPCLTSEGPPDLVIIRLTGDPSGFENTVADVESACETSQIVLVAETEQMQGIMTQFKSRAYDFMIWPIDEVTLEITLKRAAEMIAWKRRVRKLEHALENRPGQSFSDALETERFIIVKQVVDKLSHFIGQIARDVEDGVKYFHSTPYFVSIHNCDLQVVANDGRYQEYFGKQVGSNSWDIYHGRSGTPDECPVGKTIETGMVQRCKTVVRYRSGEKAPVIVHTAPIYDNNGRISLILEVISGSREIKRLRTELRATQQRYQKLFDEVPDYIAVLDRKFRLMAVNRRFKEEFGDRSGIGFFEIFRKKSFSSEDCPLVKTLKDGKPHHVETELITREGRQLKVMLSTAAITAVGGKIIQIIVIFKDVTHLRQLEDNLSTLGLMFSVISHNIKNVLTGLDAGLYHIDYGLYKNVPGRIEEGLEVANLMVHRIRKMILDVLYYAKPRELQLDRVESEDLVDDIAQEMQPKMGARNIEFQWDGGEEGVEFPADREIFRSILVNLLENAMDACMDQKPEKHHKIRFTATGEGAYVRFDVIDNGVGMEEEKKNKIFSKFYSTKGNKGTGLGLFIARQVVDEHKGRILVESKPGEGSCFTVLMPRLPHENGTGGEDDTVKESITSG